jgi:hypothetical protein
MIAFKIFLKVLPYIWPFIREMVLGRKSILAALRDNKKKVLFISLVLFSFCLNFLTIPRLLSLSAQYVALEKRYKDVQTHPASVGSTVKHPTANGVEQKVHIKEPPHVAVIETVEKKPIPSKKKKKVIVSDPNVNQIKEQFEKIRSREENELTPPSDN